MKKEFSLSKEKAILNFSLKYCETFDGILNSNAFKTILRSYISDIQNKSTKSYNMLSHFSKDASIDTIVADSISIFKLLTIMAIEEVVKIDENYSSILNNREVFVKYIEGLYSYWRKLERYSVINSIRRSSGFSSVSFIDANNKFSDQILSLYRKISKNILGKSPTVYRQLPAGVNAGIIVNNTGWSSQRGYEILEEIPFIQSVVLEAPFITYPKKNKRDQPFYEVFSNPLLDININKEQWFCYPAKIGDLIGYIYFHRDFMSHGITLCNLFEMAKYDEYAGKKPDLVYVFGVPDENENKNVFYHDKKADIMLGYASYSEDIDYFGYMKKMCLTLHNLIQINRGNLPIHGAMVNITLKSGKSSNVVLVGDSGAGKSESLEAFRSLSSDHIADMVIVYDDMGMITKKDDKYIGVGTEIGAFVRLDDLDQGYAFKELDRSIFMNPDKINARLVMPVATYEEIIKGYEVEYILYANNYDGVEENGKHISFFENSDEAIKVFKEGKRMSKGTTTEDGIVESYFANPFGPMQKQEETDKLIEEYFKGFFGSNIKVGQIKTCLGIQGSEKEGPRKAALELFDLISK